MGALFLLATVPAIAVVMVTALWLHGEWKVRPSALDRSHTGEHTGAPHASIAPAFPRITIIIPTYNEELFIGAKLANTIGLAYPGGSRGILVVDGGSTDRTRQLVQEFAAAHPNEEISLMVSEEAGKIPQLNAALDTLDERELVVITDADSRILTPDALIIGVRALAADGVDVIGGYTELVAGRRAARGEVLFWNIQNRLRVLESRSYSANIALAPFYLFRRSFIDSFPENCAADDVYVSFLAHSRRRRVIYSEEILVTEERFPLTLVEGARQKIRKIRAYTRELVRYAPRLVTAHPMVSLGCAGRGIVFFVWPVAVLLIAFGIATGNGTHSAVLLALLMMIAAGYTFRRAGFETPRIFALAEIFCVLSVALVWNLVSFAFVTEGSRYSRVTGAATEDMINSGLSRVFPEISRSAAASARDTHRAAAR